MGQRLTPAELLKVIQKDILKGDISLSLARTLLKENQDEFIDFLINELSRLGIFAENDNLLQGAILEAFKIQTQEEDIVSSSSQEFIDFYMST